MGETRVETTSRDIPMGCDCGSCPHHKFCPAHQQERCTVFDEPYNGTKNDYCYRNKHIDSCHQAWIGEGRMESKK